MAERRMFSKAVVDTDKFLELSRSARLLYFDLGIRADDDGFVGSPKRITRMTGADEKDLEELIDEGYLIPFKSGVIVITHWKINNYLRSDRYHDTVYLKERELLAETANRAYELRDI